MKSMNRFLCLLNLVFLGSIIFLTSCDDLPTKPMDLESYSVTVKNFWHDDDGWHDKVFENQGTSWLVHFPDEYKNVDGTSYPLEYTFEEDGVKYTYEFDYYKIGEVEIEESFLDLTSDIVIEVVWIKYKNNDGVLFDEDEKTLIRVRSPSDLKDYIIPNGVETIAKRAFSECSNLENITIPETVSSIEDGAFEKTGIKSVKLPGSITKLGSGIFYNCKSLETVEFPENYNYEIITERMFSLCESLAKISLPNSTTEIDGSAFSSCESLTEITMPETVESIGDLAFKDCKSLSSFTIPASCRTIGQAAFSNCKKIEYIEIPSTVRKLSGRLFYDWTEDQVIKLVGFSAGGTISVFINNEDSTPEPLDEWFSEISNEKHWWYEGCHAKIYADDDETDLNPNNI